MSKGRPEQRLTLPLPHFRFGFRCGVANANQPHFCPAHPLRESVVDGTGSLLHSPAGDPARLRFSCRDAEVAVISLGALVSP
jgi:hypothetical protein